MHDLPTGSNVCTSAPVFAERVGRSLHALSDGPSLYSSGPLGHRGVIDEPASFLYSVDAFYFVGERR